MKKDGWNDIYEQKGEVQKVCLQKVIDVVSLFKEKGYKRVLDLGCGTGRHSIYMASMGFDVYATDISRIGVQTTEEKAKYNNFAIHTSVHDMRSIPFDNNFFDAVICVLTIDHGTQEQVKNTVHEIFRVLKKGGSTLIDFMSTEDTTFGLGRKIEEQTFIDSMEDEEGIIHHYSTHKELELFFSSFEKSIITANDYHYYNRDIPYIIKSFDVIAQK